MSIFAINVSGGGVPKYAVPEARVTRLGLVGDSQADLKHHGGPDRAVCLFSLDVIRRMQAEGHPILPGSAGENLTIEGLDWSTVRPGVRLAIGEGDDRVELEIVSYTVPCSNIRASFANADIRRISQDVHPGQSRLYARVNREGIVRLGHVCHTIS